MKMPASLFVQRLKERLKAGDGYIMGAVGQDPKKLSAWYYNQYSGSQYTKAVYWKNHAERVWDCQGLAEGLYNEYAGTSINVRARNNYASWCSDKGSGIIPPSKRVPGAAVFWSDGSASVIHHVAYLTEPVVAGKPEGDWYLIEARGVMYGVVRTQLLNRKPNFWGLMDKYFSYDGTADEPVIPETGGLTVASGSWNIRSKPSASSESIGTVKGGEKLEKVETDWIPVVFNGEIGWISPKGVKEEGNDVG